MARLTTEVVTTLKPIEVFHRGQFSTLHIAEYTRNGQRYKVIAKQIHFREFFDEHTARLFCDTREMKWKKLYDLKHANIVRYFEAFFKHMILREETPPQALLVMEYLPGPDLRHLINKQDLPRTLAIDYTKQILIGLEYLHVRKVVHKTLQPRCLFMDDRDSLGVYRTIKIAHLDEAVMFDEEMGAITDYRRINTAARYMSPEMAQRCRLGTEDNLTVKITPKCDIWSVGVILLDMIYFTGSTTFERTKTRPLQRKRLRANDLTSPDEVTKFVLEGGNPLIPNTAARQIGDFCERCFERNSIMRPSATLMLAHGLFALGGARTGEYLI